mgnify:CR=1 FL=1
MEFFEAVKARRSIRKYLPDVEVADDIVEKALDAALLAPNSSNMQTWEFYWVQTPQKKQKLVEACLSQNAARSAKHLLVFVANPGNWRRSQKEMVRQISQNGVENAPKLMLTYYEKLIPMTYGMSFLAPLKWLIYNTTGLCRPMSRRPWSARDVQEVAIKSSALAAENFMLAISAQGYDTCPMEGFDEVRVKKILGLKSCSARVVMVVSVGKRDPNKVWGEQVRFDKTWFIKKI